MERWKLQLHAIQYVRRKEFSSKLPFFLALACKMSVQSAPLLRASPFATDRDNFVL